MEAEEAEEAEEAWCEANESSYLGKNAFMRMDIQVKV